MIMYDVDLPVAYCIAEVCSGQIETESGMEESVWRKRRKPSDRAAIPIVDSVTETLDFGERVCPRFSSALL